MAFWETDYCCCYYKIRRWEAPKVVLSKFMYVCLVFFDTSGERRARQCRSRCGAFRYLTEVLLGLGAGATKRLMLPDQRLHLLMVPRYLFDNITTPIVHA